MEGSNPPLVAADGKHKVEEGSTFNLKWLVSTVLAIWPWLLGSIIISLIIGNLYLRYTTPVYRSYAKLLIADSKGGSSSGGSDIANMLNLNNKKINIDNEIEIIKSRTTMLKVASELHLNVNYSIAGRLKITQLYGSRPFDFVIVDSADTYYNCKVNIPTAEKYELIESNGNVVHGKWGDTVTLALGRVVLKKTPIFRPTSAQYTINVSPMLAAAMSYNVIINPPRNGTSFITLFMLDVLPERSEDIINKLMEVYAESNVQIRNSIADSTMNFIARRIQIVDTELSSIEKGIEEFKQTHGITNMATQSEQLITANSEILQNLAAQEYDLEVTEAVSNYLSRVGDEQMIFPASLLSNTGLSGLMDKYNALETEIENSLITNTAENPVTRTLIRQREEVKQNIVSSLASSKRELQLKVNKTRKELGLVNRDIRNVPKMERLFLEYSRKQAIKQDLFIFLLKKREDAAIEKAATVSDAHPIDPASTLGIVLPNHSRVLMLAFLFGTIIPFGIILLRRALNIKIINKSDVMKVTSIPIIGEIGNNADGESVAIKRSSRTIIAEQFRALRTNLQYLLTDKDDKVLMITSSMSGEGKSFIAINLSITLAMSGKKVVLLEFDLRKPKISKALNMDNNIGFSNYAIGKAGYDDIIIPSDIDPNLFILPSGPIPPNPSELVLLHRTEELFAYLRANFDYVIMDTSPLGLVTDAQLLNKYTDTTLFIVRQGYTYKQQLNIPNELYISGKISRISLIINDVIANRGFAYGYGYEEGYGYGYGGYGYGYGNYGSSYYVSEKKKGIKHRFKFRKKEND